MVAKGHDQDLGCLPKSNPFVNVFGDGLNLRSGYPGRMALKSELPD